MIARILPMIGFVLFMYGLYTGWDKQEQWRNVERVSMMAQRQQKIQELESKKAELKRGEEFEQKLNEKIAELQELASVIQKNSEKLPDGAPKMHEVIKSLAQVASRVGIQFQYLRPGADKPGEVISVLPMDVNVQGTYVQIMSFLDGISELTRVISTDKILLDAPMNKGSARVISAQVTLLAPYLSASAASVISQNKNSTPTEEAQPGGGQ